MLSLTSVSNLIRGATKGFGDNIASELAVVGRREGAATAGLLKVGKDDRALEQVVVTVGSASDKLSVDVA